MNADKNLTIEDYNKIVADEEKIQLAIIQTNKVIFDKNLTHNLEQFDDRYLEHKTVSYDISEVEDVQDILDIIDKYKRAIKELPKHIFYLECVESTVDSYYGEPSLDDFTLEYIYFIPFADNSRELRSRVEERVANKVEKMLQPNSSNYAKHLDCALLDQFKAGKIDWLTMQEIVYNK